MTNVIAADTTAAHLDHTLEDAVLYALHLEIRVTPLVFPFSHLQRCYPGENWAPFFAAMHRLHVAAHTVDDVIDEDVTRDERPTTHAQYGKANALMAAIFLIFDSHRATCSTARHASPAEVRRICELLASSSLGVVVGNYRELQLRHKQLDVAQWTDLAKTCVGPLVAGAWHSTAIVAGERWSKALDEALWHCGAALRLFDDYYDAHGKRADERTGAPNLFINVSDCGAAAAIALDASREAAARAFDTAGSGRLVTSVSDAIQFYFKAAAYALQRLPTANRPWS
jgi:geranylgeranyl pyrophosphate synthase